MAAPILFPRDDHYEKAVTKNTFDGRYTLDSIIVTLSLALGLYNSLEMILLISSTFKKWKGLYFWSLNICNWGVILYALGMMLSYFELCSLLLHKIILDAGWWIMVASQAVVLYSRLGLIVENQKILTAVKWMIIFVGTVVCFITDLMDFGMTYLGGAWTRGYFYIEPIQIIFITLQEVIISGIYVWKTLALLKITDKVSDKKNTRSMMWQLFIINVIIISMDIAILTMQFLHYQLYQEALKTFVYSVKLKLELNILSKLVDLVHGDTATRSMTLDPIDSNAIAGQAQADVRAEMSNVNRVHSWYGRNEKDPIKSIEEGGSSEQRRSGSSSRPPDDDDDNGINRVFSNQSRVTARTSGRESDLLYADMLRSMK